MLRASLILTVALAAAAPASASDRSRPAAPADASDDMDRQPAKGARSLADAKAPFPAGVRRVLEAGRRDCLAEGGARLRRRPGIVRSADLDGDGRPDFVVDFRESRCDGRPAMFNGTGGWDLVILVARARGATREVFSGRVRDYDVLPGQGPRRVAFDLHGSFCGLAGTDDCRKTRTITTRPFAFRER